MRYAFIVTKVSCSCVSILASVLFKNKIDDDDHVVVAMMMYAMHAPMRNCHLEFWRKFWIDLVDRYPGNFKSTTVQRVPADTVCGMHSLVTIAAIIIKRLESKQTKNAKSSWLVQIYNIYIQYIQHSCESISNHLHVEFFLKDRKAWPTLFSAWSKLVTIQPSPSDDFCQNLTPFAIKALVNFPAICRRKSLGARSYFSW